MFTVAPVPWIEACAQASFAPHGWAESQYETQLGAEPGTSRF
jgi:hypothetical protein